MILEKDIPYFTTIAASAAALLGLSFFALIFFLTDLFHRFQGLSIPVHPQELQKGGENKDLRPEDVTDFVLFDGDPLVVFSAFSVAVTWNLYFVSLVISITAVSHQFDTAWTFAIELIAFFAFLAFSVIVRNAKRRNLATYRTRDEKLWPVFEWAVVVVCGIAAIIAVIGALTMGCGERIDGLCWMAFWVQFGIHTVDLLSLVLKIVCLGGLCAGLYATNKDLFVYFKARTSDEMRMRWLGEFVKRYSELQNLVNTAKDKKDLLNIEQLLKLWNNGCPPLYYIRDGFSPWKSLCNECSADKSQDERWKCLLDTKRNRSIASWMFDVPGIAKWEADINALLPKWAVMGSNQG